MSSSSSRFPVLDKSKKPKVSEAPATARTRASQPAAATPASLVLPKVNATSAATAAGAGAAASSATADVKSPNIHKPAPPKQPMSALLHQRKRTKDLTSFMGTHAPTIIPEVNFGKPIVYFFPNPEELYGHLGIRIFYEVNHEKREAYFSFGGPTKFTNNQSNFVEECEYFKNRFVAIELPLFLTITEEKLRAAMKEFRDKAGYNKAFQNCCDAVIGFLLTAGYPVKKAWFIESPQDAAEKICKMVLNECNKHQDLLVKPPFDPNQKGMGVIRELLIKDLEKLEAQKCLFQIDLESKFDGRSIEQTKYLLLTLLNVFKKAPLDYAQCYKTLKHAITETKKVNKPMALFLEQQYMNRFPKEKLITILETRKKMQAMRQASRANRRSTL